MSPSQQVKVAPINQGEIMKKIATTSIALGLLFALLSPVSPALAANKAGGKCATVKEIVKIGSSKYECKLSTKTQKTTWTKIVVPAGFSCAKSKKALPILNDSFETLASYMDIVKDTYPETDPFYISTAKGIAKAEKDLATLKSAVKRYC
jgi:hypothetical protein